MAGGVGPVQAAKKAFVRVLLHLASVYGVAANVNRESPDDDLMKAFRKVAFRCHPDKGGIAAHTKNLNVARDAWKEAQNLAGSLRKVCREVIDKEGAARRG